MPISCCLCTTVLPTARASARGASYFGTVKRCLEDRTGGCPAKMRRALFPEMTAPSAPVSSPTAIAAFLRGVAPRARLLATVQAGASKPAEQALAVVAQVFATEAGQWPIAQWPQQYWRLLLATPHLRQPDPSEPGVPLPGIARLPPTQRAAFLLQLVAELDDSTAATALGTSVRTYQDAIRDGLPRDVLGQPDIDVWRAWRSAVQRELATAEPAPLAAGTRSEPGSMPADSTRADRKRANEKSPNTNPAKRSLAHEDYPEAGSHRHVRWLWLGVVICVLAFATTFFLHPAGRAVIERWTATIQVEALPAADAPRARFDAGDAALHPDHALLAAPEEAAHASQLAMLSWLAVNSEDPRAADAMQLPVVLAPVPRAAMDPAHETARLAARQHQWDALPARARGLRRGQWQAWRALTAPERIQLRTLAQRWRALGPQQQQLLRERFMAQPSDARNGWWLGPALGRDWPRIHALFALVDAAERDALLQLLRHTETEGWDVLARLAQITPPEARAQLRSELLAQAPSHRGAWLRAQLAR